MTRRLAPLAAVLAVALSIPALVWVVAGSGNGSSTKPIVQTHRVGLLAGAAYIGGSPAAPVVGDTLTTTNGTWGNNPTLFTYQWQHCAGAVCTNAPGVGATTRSYTVAIGAPPSGDEGDTLKVIVTAINANGSASQTSAATGVVTSGSGSGSPANTASPAVIDTTLLNNYEEPDTVRASAGSWTNAPTSYTYQFQDCSGISGTTGTGCRNINTPQCSSTAATTCTYSLSAEDVGNYIVASVTATNAAGSSSPAASQAQGTVVPSRIDRPCTSATALTDYLNGPHLCGFPDATNTGYAHAPGFNGENTGGAYPVNPTPGSLTPAGTGNCPTAANIQSNHTYIFCRWGQVNLPANLTNVTIYGSAFAASNNCGSSCNSSNDFLQLVNGGSNMTGIVFDYDTWQPNITYPGPPNPSCYPQTSCETITCSQGYQHGIYNQSGGMKGFTVEHSRFWGFGEAIDTAGSTQANPQTFKYNFFSDAVQDPVCGYHHDGIGLQVTNTTAYVTTDHNAFSFVGNTNEIAWQNGTYDHMRNTNNFMDGDNAMYAGARGTGTNIATEGNIFDAFLPHGAGNFPIDLAGGYATATGSTWFANYWMVPPGTDPSSATGISSTAPGRFDAQYIVPITQSSGFPNDCGWTYAADNPNYGNNCTAGGSVPTNTTQPYFTPGLASSTDGTCQAGCAIQGQTLSVTQGKWSNNPTGYTYQWQDCTTTAGTNTGTPVTGGGASNVMTLPTSGPCSNISGATSSSYTIQASDVGKALAVNVTAINARGSTATVPTGSCNTGLMTTAFSVSGPDPPTSTYFDNGHPGCSPISAVVGSGQYGANTGGERFCTNAPTTCGFADIANAGVPAGTALYAVPGTCTSPAGPGARCSATGSGWSYSGGVITMTSNSVLQNVSFAAGTNRTSVISVPGGTSNITIQNSDISSGCNCNYQAPGGLIVIAGSAQNITIQDNNLHGIDTTAGDGCNAAVYAGSSTGTNITVANNDVYFCATGFNLIAAPSGGWAIDSNYIHDFAWADSAKSNHFDGIQFEGGGSANSPTDFVNNTALMNFGQTGPIIISSDNSLPNTYRWVSHNLLAGGAVTLYFAGTADFPTTHSTFTNNVFTQVYMGDHSTMTGFGSGTYGPSAYWTPSTNTWSNGIWDDNGGAITPDDCNNINGNYCP
jgi:hypothetical protein